MAHVGAPNLHLHLTMHFRFHCQMCAHLPAKTLTLTLEMVSTAGRFPLLGLVPLPLVGCRSKPPRQARCLLLCPPLGLVLLPLVGRRSALLPRACSVILRHPLGLVPLSLKGCHGTPTSIARWALSLQVPPRASSTSLGKALHLHVCCKLDCVMGFLLQMVVRAG